MLNLFIIACSENIYIDKNRFGPKGIELSIHTSELYAEGELKFGALTPLKYA